MSLIRSSILTPEKSQSYLTPNYIPTSIFIELEKYIRKLDFGSNKVQHLRDLGKIIGRFNDEDYRGAFLLGWLFIEESLTKRWIKYLDSKNTQISEEVNRISKNRKKILTGRDYSISIIIDQLELNERITLNEYNEYSKLRKIRNKIVHNDYRPTLSDAENMNRVIRPIFEELVQFKLKYPEHVYGSTGL